jgi:hypothetical protein
MRVCACVYVCVFVCVFVRVRACVCVRAGALMRVMMHTRSICSIRCLRVRAL